MSCKYIIGYGAALDSAVAGWHDSDASVQLNVIRLAQDASYLFDLSVLDTLSASDATAFVACDAQFLNFRRFELMGELKTRGFKMPPLISRGALVDSSARIEENVLIGTGAIIGGACHIGFNAVIGAGVNIGYGSRIGSSAWVEAGVIIGRHAKIGTNTTIGYGVIVGDAIEIGKACLVDVAGKLRENVAAKTFMHNNFDKPITIIEY